MENLVEYFSSLPWVLRAKVIPEDVLLITTCTVLIPGFGVLQGSPREEYLVPVRKKHISPLELEVFWERTFSGKYVPKGLPNHFRFIFSRGVL